MIRIWQAATLGLFLLCLWLASAVVRLENYHYGSLVGMCDEVPDPLIRTLNVTTDRHACLHETQTRTSATWHLYYALVEAHVK